MIFTFLCRIINCRKRILCLGGENLEEWRKDFYQEIKNISDEFVVNKPKLELSRADYFTFFKTGNRLEFEYKYFERRKYLTALAMMAYIENNDEYHTALDRIINLICSEYSWALPAHLPESPEYIDYSDKSNMIIDLFAAETAQSLSEIIHLFSDSLSSKLQAKVHEEIQKRIFTPFGSKEWGWEKLKNNWSSVIASCIGMIALYELPYESNEQLAILSRLRSVFSVYFSSFGQDGACEEGVAYWAYGFGYFNYFNECYRTVYKKDFYCDKELLRQIAAFPSRVELADGLYVPFSDATEAELPSGLLSYCQSNYSVSIPKVKYVTSIEHDSCYRWAVNYRNWIWTKPVAENLPAFSVSHFFNDVQWLIYKNQHFFFAAKGGHNNESHNHNDIGHFILGNSSNLVFTDLGAGEYTKFYFDDRYRYDILNNRSLGHSVPVINGCEQKNGNYGATEVQYKNKIQQISFEMTIDEVYPSNAELKYYKRSFIILTDSIEVYDQMLFQKADNTVIQNLVCVNQPIIKDKLLVWKNNHLTYELMLESSDYEISVNATEYFDHQGEVQEIFLVQITKNHIDYQYDFRMKINFKED